MTYEQAEGFVHSLTRFGSQLGLGRMRKLLLLLGNPQDELRYIHIAGTNGKGSTAKMTASILQEAGFAVGLYTSPYVVQFLERYQIDGKMMRRDEFTGLVQEVGNCVQQLAMEGEYVTEFEMVTAAGFLWFARQKCDIVVLEVGLGGRYDATNVIYTPLCAAITALSLDHTMILGDTVEQIAGEKAGIIKEDSDLVLYPIQEPGAMAVVLERCARTGSRLVQPNRGALTILEETALGSHFLYDDREYRLRLAGEHQIYNAVTVIEIIRVMRRKGWAITEPQLEKGLETAFFPARFELLCRRPMIIADGAHNVQAAAALASSLRMLDQEPKIAILGMMADKDYSHAAEVIARQCRTVFTVSILNNPRTADPFLLATAARNGCQNAHPAPDYETALEEALRLAGDEGAVVICGSFYLACDMRKVVKEKLKGRPRPGGMQIERQ